MLTAKTHSPKSTDTRSSKSMPWFAARHAAHPCQTGPRQEVCGRNGVISWLGVPSSGCALTNKHISYHELSKRETRATVVMSGALLSSLGGSGAVGFLNAPTGSASLYPTGTVLQHCWSQKSVRAKNLLWRQVAYGCSWPHHCPLLCT